AGLGGAAGGAMTAKDGRKTEAALGGGLGAAGGSVIGNKLGGSTGATIGAGLGGAAGGAVGNNLGKDNDSGHRGKKHRKHKHR
ncbi:TPA: glycine zipper domain-containing protein, partial [Pseudomonas aeruginosa]